MLPTETCSPSRPVSYDGAADVCCFRADCIVGWVGVARELEAYDFTTTLLSTDVFSQICMELDLQQDRALDRWCVD